MSLITVFTPTYNRAHTLPRLYQSLLNQDYKNFEWLIVDDGSTDKTLDLVNKLKAENKINIRYYQQKNAGKHIAINTAQDLAKGEYLLIMDSDDYLSDHALRISLDLLQKHCNTEKIMGVATPYVIRGKVYDKNVEGVICSSNDLYYIHHVEIDVARIFKTSVFKNYKFPEFEGEKFCRESLVYNRICQDGYVFYHTSQELYIAEYQEDGLTSNSWRRMLDSPNYAQLLYQEKTEKSFPKEVRLEAATLFWQFAGLNKNRLKSLFKIPIDLTFQVFWKKIVKK